MKPKLLILFAALVVTTAALFAAHTEFEDTTSGLKIGKAAGQKLAFHGSAPVAQRSGSAQAVVTPTIGVAVVTTASTQSSPFGFVTQAQGDALVSRVNQLLVDSAAQTVLINELRAALVEKGLVKGGS